MPGFLTRLRNCVRRRALTQAGSTMQRRRTSLPTCRWTDARRVTRRTTALIADGVLPAGIDQSRIVVEPPRDAGHGDMATNAAMVLAKDAGKKPRELAEAIADKLRADDAGRRRSMSRARASSI